MKRSEANREIAKRLGWRFVPQGIGVWRVYDAQHRLRREVFGYREADALVKLAPDYFALACDGEPTEAALRASRELMLYVSREHRTAFLEELRGVLIDKTGKPVGIADFMLATPEQIAHAACAVWGIELDDE